jgi:hypothetical protein
MYIVFPHWDLNNGVERDADIFYVRRDEGSVFRSDENLAYDVDYENSARSDNSVVLKAKIGDLVGGFIDCNQIARTTVLDPNALEQARAISKALKANALMLDKVINATEAAAVADRLV